MEINTLKNKKDLIDLIYPVGSIKMQTSSQNPSEFLGVGTWVEWGKGRVPVGVDTGDKDFSSVEYKNGNKSNSHQHAVGEQITNTNVIGGDAIVSRTNFTGAAATSTLQPYITCYMFKRTA